MNINFSYDMKIEHFYHSGFFYWLTITKETVEIIKWVLSLLHFVTLSGSGQTAPVNAGCCQAWLTFAFHICYWAQPWHDQKLITMTLHSSVDGKGLNCKVKRGDGHTLLYKWHVWEGQSWKVFRVPRNWGSQDIGIISLIYWQAKILLGIIY